MRLRAGRDDTMLRRAIIRLTLAAALSAAAGAGAAPPLSMSVRAERTRIYLGESFLLYVEVQGARDLPSPPDLSALPAETRLLGSQDTSRDSIRIVNGRVTRESFQGRTFVFAVKPREAGRFRAGPVTLDFHGQRIEAAGEEVEVVGVVPQTDVIVTVESSSEAVLVEEPFTVTLRVAVAALPPPNAHVEPLHRQRPPRIEAEFLELRERPGLRQPDIRAILQGMISRSPGAPAFKINDYRSRGSGFGGFGGLFDDLFEPQPILFRLPAKKIRRQGRDYWEYALTLDYTPSQEGDYTFGPVTFKGAVITGGDAAGRPLFRDVFAVGPAITVRVVPPPESGRPEWFVGAVGRSLEARAELDTAVCKVGDPLTLTLTLTGDISLANLRPPLLSLQPEMPADLFRVYDENVASEPVPGGKRYRYRVRPLRSGTIEFPAIRVAYFDTRRKEYVTVRTPPLPLQVHETTQIAAAADDGAPEGGTRALTAGRRPVPDGILLPADGHAPPPPGPPPPLRRRLLAMPPCLWGLVWSLREGWRRRRAWAQRLRRRTALPPARRELARARREAAQAPVAAAARATQALRRYLAVRTDVAGGALTASEMTAFLRTRGVEAAQAEDFQRLFAELEQIPYRPGSAEPETVATCIRKLARHLPAVDKRLRRAARRGGAAASALPALLPALLLALSSATVVRADQETDRFTWERANALMATAREPEDFLAAARLYHRLASGGGGGGALLYNLGTALLLAEDPVNAEAALIRAERYLGAAPELRANWRLAIAARTGQPDAQLPPSRLLFAWHHGLSLHLRIWLALTGWLLLWAGLTLRLLTRPARRRRGAPTSTRAFAGLLAWCSCLLALLYGTSAAITLLQERQDARLWRERVPGPAATAAAQPRAGEDAS